MQKYYFKMLADVIEALIGAIFMDNKSIKQTKEIWENLFGEYFKIYADNPEVHPMDNYMMLFNQYPYLGELRQEIKVNKLEDHTYTFCYKDKVLLTHQFQPTDKKQKVSFYIKCTAYLQDKISKMESTENTKEIPDKV